MNIPIFTLSPTNLRTEEEIFDALAVVDYFTEESAINAARELAQKCAKNYEDVCTVTVFAGEYKKETGDVVGEPHDIYTISSKCAELTAEARRNAGYVRLEVDEYV